MPQQMPLGCPYDKCHLLCPLCHGPIQQPAVIADVKFARWSVPEDPQVVAARAERLAARHEARLEALLGLPPAPVVHPPGATRLVRSDPTSIAVTGSCPERDRPLTPGALYKSGLQPPEQLPAHHECGICRLDRVWAQLLLHMPSGFRRVQLVVSPLPNTDTSGAVLTLRRGGLVEGCISRVGRLDYSWEGQADEGSQAPGLALLLALSLTIMSRVGRLPYMDVLDMDQDDDDPAADGFSFAADRGIYFSADSERQTEEPLNAECGAQKAAGPATGTSRFLWAGVPVPDQGFTEEEAVEVPSGSSLHTIGRIAQWLTFGVAGSNPASAIFPTEAGWIPEPDPEPRNDSSVLGKRKDYAGTFPVVRSQRNPMSKWRPLKAFFLDEVNHHESLGDDLADPRCGHCSTQFDFGNPASLRLFKCYDFGEYPQCEGCCIKNHERTPLHVLKVLRTGTYSSRCLDIKNMTYTIPRGQFKDMSLTCENDYTTLLEEVKKKTVPETVKICLSELKAVNGDDDELSTTDEEEQRPKKKGKYIRGEVHHVMGIFEPTTL
ncbi:hypothetical protein DFH07DRAFT_777257 [Mycena maculata]|uniref:Uncharacterized protein n=1 Tax=Mycena maculata TaxID=230809 RepID=A0AAD7III4_9AGAR|nr:hypothetical protein DFH07DRAFT_777257 [Mycena maculata]